MPGSLTNAVVGSCHRQLRTLGLAVVGAGCLVTALLGMDVSSAAASSPLTLTGEQPHFAFSSQSLSASMGLAVNVASGNLLVQANDLRIAGTGLDLGVARSYNSQSGQNTDFGGFWTMNSGADVRLAYNTPSSGQATFYGPSGYVVVLSPNGSGGFNDPDGLNATLTHNGDGTSKLAFFETGETYNFNSAGQLISDVDKHGNTVSYSYTGGKLSSITDTRKRTVSVQSNSAGQITQLTDSNGPSTRAWKYAYTNGDLTGYTDPAGQTTGYQYTGSHLLSQITDPNGNQTLIAYGSNGQVSSISRAPAAGGSAEVTKFAYSLSPSSPCPSGAYGETTVTDPNGHATIYCYDSAGRSVLSQNPDGHNSTQKWGYDDLPSSTTSSDQAAAGVNTSLTYNGNNALTGITTGTGANSAITKTLGYTPGSGNPDPYQNYDPTSVTDAQGNKTTYGYDASGNMTSVQNPLGSSDTLTYNAQGELTGVTDANGHSRSYGYDSQGQLTTLTPAQPSSLKATTIGYDGLSRITSVTDGNGNKRTYSYDAMNRVTQIVFADGSKESYSYDANGNQLSQTDTAAGGGTQTTNNTYDELNRLTKTSFPTGYTVSYSHDAANNLASFTDGGGTVSYSYDPANLLTSLTDTNGKTTFGYNGDGGRTSQTYPNGAVENFTYDPATRVTGVSAKTSAGTVLASDSYTYGTSPAGNPSELLASVTDNAANKTVYSYNTANELKQALTTNSSSTTTDNYQYTYDAAGNHTSQTTMYNSGSTTTQTLAYNAANQICWSIVGSSPSTCGSPPTGATTLSYDANGNELGASGQTQLTWNTQNQMTSEQDSPTAPVIKDSYLGSGQGNRVQEGATTFENSQLGITATTNGGVTTYYTRDPSGAVIDSRQTSNSSYQDYIYDGQGNVIALYNSLGSLHRTYKYGPNGSVVQDTGSGYDTPLRYHGAWNGAGNMYHFGARDYDPILRAWTQPDPLNQPTDLSQANSYVYVGNNPINNVDPTGKSIFGDALKVGSLIAHGVESVGVVGLGVAAFSACEAGTGGAGTPVCAAAGGQVVAAGLIGGYATYREATK